MAEKPSIVQTTANPNSDKATELNIQKLEVLAKIASSHAYSSDSYVKLEVNSALKAIIKKLY